MMRPNLRSLRAALALPLLASTPAIGLAAPAPWPDPACAGKAHAPGLAAYEIAGSAAPRRYLVYVPRLYDGAAPLPAVFDFHGSGSHPEQELEISGMRTVAEERGMVLVLPVARAPFAAGGYTWNVPPDPALPDDLRFAREVLADVERRLCLAPGGVYLTGFSGGARFACRGPAYWGYGVDSAVIAWAGRNGCRGGPTERRVSTQVVRVQPAACPEGGEVVLYRIEGAGHTWPGTRLPLPPERFGRAARDLDATALIAEFFAADAPAQAF